MVLTSDVPELLRELRIRRGVPTLPMGYGSPDVWISLGLQNPNRPELPHPATIVFAPDGTEVLRRVHTNFRERSDPSVAVGHLAQGPTSGPDWEHGARVSVFRTGDELVLEIVVAPGFHVYGSAEPMSLPVYLRIPGVPPATVPPGEAHAWPGGESFVLQGTVQVRATVGPQGVVTGQAGWQLCTDDACSAPRNDSFALGPGERAELG